MDQIILAANPQVNGLYYTPHVIDDTIGLQLIEQLDEYEWVPITNSIHSRVVQHYGYRYDYFKQNVAIKCEDIPSFLIPLKDLLTRICLNQNIISPEYNFNQCIVNNYNAKQGISEHIDIDKFGSVIGCFTIGTGAIMKFTRKDELVELYVEPNSLYIMSGDARYVWKHSMPAKKYDLIDNIRYERKRRISITFRSLY